MGLPNIGPIELLILLGIVALIVAALLAGWRGRRSAIPAPVPDELLGEDVILRTYGAARPSDAIVWYQRDLYHLVEHGYLPSTQSWIPGQWSGWAFLATILLMPIYVGFIILVYLLIVRPHGTMVATYVRRDLMTSSVVAGPVGGSFAVGQTLPETPPPW